MLYQHRLRTLRSHWNCQRAVARADGRRHLRLLGRKLGKLKRQIIHRKRKRTRSILTRLRRKVSEAKANRA